MGVTVFASQLEMLLDVTGGKNFLCVFTDFIVHAPCYFLHMWASLRP